MKHFPPKYCISIPVISPSGRSLEKHLRTVLNPHSGNTFDVRMEEILQSVGVGP